MKKLLAILLSLAMVFTLAACGGSASSTPAASTPAADGGDAASTPAADGEDPYAALGDFTMVVGHA